MSENENSVSAELERVRGELELRERSLALIGQLLNAETLVDESAEAERLRSATLSVGGFIEGDFDDACAVVKSHTPDIFASYAASDGGSDGGYRAYHREWQQRYREWMAQMSKSWLHNKKCIAFVGEFSAGKTSIVNTILSQSEGRALELPVSMKATTAIPTYVLSGEQERCLFVAPDEKVKAFDRELFSSFSKEMLPNLPGARSLIKYFVLSCRNPHLEELSLLDTPGFSSNDDDDARRTLDVINECDALFWVFDVNAGALNATSLKLIKENLRRPLFLVMNKVDGKSPKSLDKVEAYVRGQLEQEGLPVEAVIRYSYEMQPDVLYEAIAHVEHDKPGRDSFLGDLRVGIETLRDRLQRADAEWRALQRAAGDQRDEVNERFKRQVLNLKKASNEIHEQPEFKSPFWGSDHYEISKSGFTLMRQMLSTIQGVSEELGQTWEHMSKQLKDVHDVYHLRGDVRSDIAMLERCLAVLDKLSSNFKDIK